MTMCMCVCVSVYICCFVCVGFSETNWQVSLTFFAVCDGKSTFFCFRTYVCIYYCCCYYLQFYFCCVCCCLLLLLLLLMLQCGGCLALNLGAFSNTHICSSKAHTHTHATACCCCCVFVIFFCAMLCLLTVLLF